MSASHCAHSLFLVALTICIGSTCNAQPSDVARILHVQQAGAILHPSIFRAPFFRAQWVEQAEFEGSNTSAATRIVRTRNGSGDLIQIAVFRGATQQPERSVIFRVTAGRLTRVTDESMNKSETVGYEYDEEGRVLRERVRKVAQGRDTTVTAEHSLEDKAAHTVTIYDGAIRREQYAYSPTEQLTKHEVLFEDGRPERVEKNDYDKKDQLISSVIDSYSRGTDGVYWKSQVERHSIEYIPGTERQLRIREVMDKFHENGKPYGRETTVREFDQGDGQLVKNELISIAIKENGQEMEQARATSIYSYDGQRRIIEVETSSHSSDNSRASKSRQRYEYTVVDGKDVVSHTLDELDDGTIEMKVVEVRSMSDGLLISREAGKPGVPFESKLVLHYDSSKRLIKEEAFKDGGSVPDRVTQYTY